MSSLSLAATPLWRTRLATFAVFFANGFGIGGWAAAIPKIKAMLAISDAELGLALLAMAAGAIGSMSMIGLLAPRLGGSGRTLRWSAVAFGLAALAPGWTWSLPSLVAATFLFGACNGLMEVPMNAHATAVERDWGAAIMSSFHAGWSLGGLAGASFVGLLIGAGVATPWLLIASGAIILGVVCPASFGLGPGDRSDGSGPHFAWPERRVLRLCLLAFVIMLIEGAMADWSAVYLTDVAAVPAAAAAGGYATYAACMLVTRGLGDHAIRIFGRRAILVAGPLLAGAGMLVVVTAPSASLTVLGFCLVGFGVANMIPTIFSVSAALSSSPALGIAMASTVGYGGFLLGPPLIGSVASLAGLRSSFALLALLLIGCIPLAAGGRSASAVRPKERQ